MRAAGFGISVVSLESLMSSQAGITPALADGELIGYRGWMLSSDEYDALSALIRGAGGKQITSPATYLLTHHLPNWYPLLKEFTPETEIVPADTDLERVVRELGWGRVFIKDYVKSLKTSVGSIVERPEDLAIVTSEMKKYRGQIEGGFCIRRVEAFLPESERRFFVIGGTPYSACVDTTIPTVVCAAAERIKSPFFSVDVVHRSDGVERIVEIGDGQVSDVVGWEVGRFAEVWREAANRQPDLAA